MNSKEVCLAGTPNSSSSSLCSVCKAQPSCSSRHKQKDEDFRWWRNHPSTFKINHRLATVRLLLGCLLIIYTSISSLLRLPSIVTLRGHYNNGSDKQQQQSLNQHAKQKKASKRRAWHIKC